MRNPGTNGYKHASIDASEALALDFVMSGTSVKPAR